MRALLFKDKLQFLADYPVPKPKYNEALVRVSMAGICGTDLEIIRGYMGFNGIPGHEFAGTVEECADERFLGKRVAGEINLGCGVCPYCLNRMRNHCPNRTVLGILNKDGAFADYLTLPARNLHLIPDSVPDEEAVFIEPLAAAFEILQQIHIKPGDRVCVIGDGRLGLLAAQVLSLTGCDLFVVGRHEKKLELLKGKGIRTAFESDFSEGDFDFVVDCAGSPSGMELAVKIVKPRGTIALKTTLAHWEEVDLNFLVINEISLAGSRCGRFGPAIRSLQMKTIGVRPLIEKTFSLEEGLEAFEHASRKGVLKVLIKM